MSLSTNLTDFEGFIQVLTQLATNATDSYLTNRISNGLARNPFS